MSIMGRELKRISSFQITLFERKFFRDRNKTALSSNMALCMELSWNMWRLPSKAWGKGWGVNLCEKHSLPMIWSWSTTVTSSPSWLSLVTRQLKPDFHISFYYVPYLMNNWRFCTFWNLTNFNGISSPLSSCVGVKVISWNEINEYSLISFVWPGLKSCQQLYQSQLWLAGS